MRSRRKVIRASLTVAISVFLGCSGSTSPAGGFTVRGSIQNNTQTTIPANTRLLVAWVVSSGSPDYTYIFGEGTIHSNGGTFEVVMTGPPPAAALNAGALGVGVIVATTNATLSTGDDAADIPEVDLVGAAGSYGVIYIADSPGAAAGLGWAGSFGAGYGVGVGQDGGGGFDTFVPTDSDDVILVIDDWSNIDFVNWT
jgi:hypothetical protein